MGRPASLEPLLRTDLLAGPNGSGTVLSVQRAGYKGVVGRSDARFMLKLGLKPTSDNVCYVSFDLHFSREIHGVKPRHRIQKSFPSGPHPGAETREFRLRLLPIFPRAESSKRAAAVQ